MGLHYRYTTVPKEIFGDKTFKNNITVQGTQIIRAKQTLKGDTQIGDASTDKLSVIATLVSTFKRDKIGAVISDLEYEEKGLENLIRRK